MSDDKFIRISQLPEASQILSEDYMVMENTEDTWKIQFQIIEKFIQSIVQSKIESDMSSTVDVKLGEIQMQMTSIDELIEQIEAKMKEFSDAEDTRASQETDRAANEAVRENIKEETIKLVDQWTNNEKDRNDAMTAISSEWDDMNDTWDDWIAAEGQRVKDENDRKTAEQNRAIAETEREKKADEFAKKAADVEASEQKRAQAFKDMTVYLQNMKTIVENSTREGTTNLLGANKVINILEVQLPISNKGYKALLHIVNGSINTFLSLDFKFTYSGSAITGGTANILIPTNFASSINISTELFIGYKLLSDNNHVQILVQYKGRTAGDVTTAIMWDNITTYNPNVGITVFAKALNDQSTSSAFITTHTAFVKNSTVSTVQNLPQGFIALFNSMNQQITTMIEAIKPFKMYPVGTVYATTSSSNPSTLLGGGKWQALYGGKGISEGYQTRNGTALTSPTIYYWQRTE